jgi:cell fate (sporulation/competence/biofilm development) regulator YmcA (YheA/YmcA/DUF963 family)
MSESVIEQLAEIILDNCNKPEEVEALVDNVLYYITELIDDVEWSPCIKDIRQSIKDANDDLKLEWEAVEEVVEIVDEGDGFISLK